MDIITRIGNIKALIERALSELDQLESEPELKDLSDYVDDVIRPLADVPGELDRLIGAYVTQK